MEPSDSIENIASPNNDLSAKTQSQHKPSPAESNSDVSAVKCTGCQNLLKQKEKDKNIWKNHLKQEVESNCNRIRKKHAEEKKELLEKIDELMAKNAILEKESESKRDEDSGNDHQEEDYNQFRRLLENNKTYRYEAEKLLYEAMNELKKINRKNKLKIEVQCQTDAKLQTSQNTQTESLEIDTHIENIAGISNKLKQLDKAIETVMQSKIKMTSQQINNAKEQSPSPAKRAKFENESPHSYSASKSVNGEQYEEYNEAYDSSDSDIQILDNKAETNAGIANNPMGSFEDNIHQENYMDQHNVPAAQVKQRTISGKENSIADDIIPGNSSGQNLQELLKNRNDNDNNTGSIMDKFEDYLNEWGSPNSSAQQSIEDFFSYIPDNEIIRQDYYKDCLLQRFENWKEKQKKGKNDEL